ncbi:MAG: hypothetical protein QOJ29_3996, partial [Thermoleophilaceae bacterium]|nr:hypothetical protein [Thermoleophilaceae bacterium]
CGSPVSYAPPFADGPYSFAVRQTDAAGNVSPVASYSWIVDSGPPAAPSINAHPSDPTNETSASFSFLPSEGGGQLRCSIDTPPAPSSTCDSRTTASYASLADGAHTFYVQQLDVANNLGPAASFTWTIDLTPPATAALQTPADGAGGQPAKPSFTWAPVPGAAKYELLVDGKLIATVASCGSTCSADATDALDERAHKWTVRTYDTAANSAASPERTFSVAVAPIASVLVAPNPVLANRPATFDGSASTDVGTGIVDYKWDLDGDGSFETDTGPNPKATQSYSTARTFTAHLRVTDGVGLTSEASTELRVTSIAPAGKPVGVSINDGAQYTNDPKVTLFAVWPSFATDMLVSNDGGFGAGQLFPVAEQQPWALDSSGPERLPKTVYVRYQAGSPTTQTFTDDIILDQTPPKVVSASVAKPAGATSAAATITLKLKATDNVSGVAGVQVSSNPKKPGAVKKFKAKLKVKKAKKLFVRVQDKAGNFSSWKPVKKH